MKYTVTKTRTGYRILTPEMTYVGGRRSKRYFFRTREGAESVAERMNKALDINAYKPPFETSPVYTSRHLRLVVDNTKDVA